MNTRKAPSAKRVGENAPDTEAERDAPAAETVEKTDNEPKVGERYVPEKPAEGLVRCYVAIPNRVSTGTNAEKAKPGTPVDVSPGNADQLEARKLAFRDKDEARMHYKGFVREQKKALEERAEALRAKEERKEAWRKELEKEVEDEWDGV